MNPIPTTANLDHRLAAEREADAIRVLVVDDSAVLRQSIRFILESDRGLKVIGEAKDGEEAVALSKRLRPDVITMDLEMPKMDGLNAIRHIMSKSPIPIVVVTSVDLDRGTDIPEGTTGRTDARSVRSQAIKLGAVSVLRRPVSATGPEYRAFATRLVEQIRLMSDMKLVHRQADRDTGPSVTEPLMSVPARRQGTDSEIQIIAIGASTGGPAALHQILTALPADLPVPVLVVQHIAFGFVEGLTGWLDATCPMKVKVAEDGERIRKGVIYVAPDDRHLEVTAYGRIHLGHHDPVGGHRPSATVLFDVVAKSYGPAAMGVILTGMGADGATGMSALREAGGATIAQDEESCVVFGMPKEAIALGAIQHVVPLDRIAPTVTALCRQSMQRRGVPALPGDKGKDYDKSLDC